MCPYCWLRFLSEGVEDDSSSCLGRTGDGAWLSSRMGARHYRALVNAVKSYRWRKWQRPSQTTVSLQDDFIIRLEGCLLKAKGKVRSWASQEPVGGLKWFVFTDNIPQFSCLMNLKPIPSREDSLNLFSAWLYYELFSNSSCTSGPQLLEMSKWVGSFIVLMYFQVSSGCQSQFCGYSHDTTVLAPQLLG